MSPFDGHIVAYPKRSLKLQGEQRSFRDPQAQALGQALIS